MELLREKQNMNYTSIATLGDFRERNKLTHPKSVVSIYCR